MLLPGCKNKAYPLPSRNSESEMYKGCNDNSKLITPRRQYSARGKGILGPVISKQGAESAQPFMCPLGLLMCLPDMRTGRHGCEDLSMELQEEGTVS